MTSSAPTLFPIQGICIPCHAGDLWRTRICVASIRYWYPDRPIYLLKDLANGPCDTAEIEALWQVQIYPLPRQRYATGLAKVELLFTATPGQRYLILDSDTVFIGPVIDALERIEGDFICSPTFDQGAESVYVNHHYFDHIQLQAFDPNYESPGYVFNTGQFVATTGLLHRSDFEPLVDWQGTLPRLRQEQIFRCWDQGILNYVLTERARQDRIKLVLHPFHFWNGSEACQRVDLDRVKARVGYPLVIHWSGHKPPLPRQSVRGDILQFYEDHYYGQIPCGESKRWYRLLRRVLRAAPQETFLHLRSQTPEALKRIVRSMIRRPEVTDLEGSQ